VWRNHFVHLIFTAIIANFAKSYLSAHHYSEDGFDDTRIYVQLNSTEFETPRFKHSNLRSYALSEKRPFAMDLHPYKLISEK